MKSVVKLLWAGVIIAAASGALHAQTKSQNQQQTAAEEALRSAERARREAEEKDWEARIFELKYANPGTLQKALDIFHVETSSPGGRLLAVRAPKEVMPAIEDVIKRLDVASSGYPAAELTIFIVMADDQPAGGATPPALQPVLTQLRNVLAYKGYHLVDTLIARGSTNNGQIQLVGSLPLNDSSAAVPTYNFYAFVQAENQDGQKPLVRLNRMTLDVSVVVGGRPTPLKIATDVVIPQDQQVVVGKATFNDKALILVISGKLE